MSVFVLQGVVGKGREQGVGKVVEFLQEIVAATTQWRLP